MSSKSARDKIIDAFCELIAKNSYASISVTDIINLAGVSRISFYRNFEDKSALVTSICYNDFISFLRIYGTKATWRQVMLCIMNSIQYHPAYYRNVILSDEGMLCVNQAMKQVSLECTSGTGSPYLYLVTKEYFQNWAKKKFSAPAETVYTEMVSQYPISEIMNEADMRAAIAKFEQRTVESFKTDKPQ